MSSPQPVPSTLGGVAQIAYSVDDVRAAAVRFYTLTGAGPFFVRDHILVQQAESGGSPALFDHSNACGQWGEFMIELVSHHELAPERLERSMRRRPGIHHLACFVPDRTRALEWFNSASADHVLSGSSLGGAARFDFLDPGEPFDHLIECYERIAPIEELYRRVCAASFEWDGSRPVRDFSELGP